MNLDKFDKIDGWVMRNKNNLKKMNILEYCYIYLFIWKEVRLKHLTEPLLNLLTSMIALMLNLVFVVTLPIHLPIQAYIDIKNARK